MNIFEKIKDLFKGIFTEGKKVDWPSRQETLRYTLVVVGISIAVAAFLGTLDFIFVKLINILIL